MVHFHIPPEPLPPFPLRENASVCVCAFGWVRVGDCILPSQTRRADAYVIDFLDTVTPTLFPDSIFTLRNSRQCLMLPPFHGLPCFIINCRSSPQ